MDECGEHLRVSDKSEAEGGEAPDGDDFGDFVERDEGVGPAVAGAEDIPGAENGSVEAAVEEELFAVAADVDIGAHDGSGMGDADIEEVVGAGGAGGLEGGLERSLVDGAELSGFGGAGVRDTGEVDVGAVGGDGAEERDDVEGVSRDRGAAEGEFSDGLGTG